MSHDHDAEVTVLTTWMVFMVNRDFGIISFYTWEDFLFHGSVGSFPMSDVASDDSEDQCTHAIDFCFSHVWQGFWIRERETREAFLAS
jgi:hypothetical protein